MSRASSSNPWGNNTHARPEPGPATSVRSSSADSGAPPTGWGSPTGPAAGPGWQPPAGPTPAQRTLVRPAMTYLWASFGAALLAIVLVMIPSGLPVYVTAWMLAAFVGFGSSALFVHQDARRQLETFYVRDPRVPWLHRGAVLLSLVAVVLAAVRIALVVGRMG